MRIKYQSRYAEAALTEKARMERMADTALALGELFSDEMLRLFNEAEQCDATSVEGLKMLKELKIQATHTSALLTKVSNYIAMRQGHLPPKSVGEPDLEEFAEAERRVEEALARARRQGLH